MYSQSEIPILKWRTQTMALLMERKAYSVKTENHQCGESDTITAIQHDQLSTK